MMNEEERAQKRAWCIDYALRLQPAKAKLTAEAVIADAKRFERYILGTPKAEMLRLTRKDRK